MELLTNPETWVALLTLTTLEIVLGIDNIVFISIMAGKLPEHQRQRARLVGLGLAMFMRIALLLSIAVIAGLTAPLFTIAGHPFSGRDIILIVGGLFLLGKSTFEIHDRLEGADTGHREANASSFATVITWIVLLDIVFSLDSVITAVGMANDIAVMIAAIVIAVIVMMVSSGPVSSFVDRHPSVKILALSFLLLIGTSLIAEGFEFHIPKEYIYFAMAFSVFVEAINIRARSRQPVQLHETYYDQADKPAAR